MHRIWFEPHPTRVALFEYSEVNFLQGCWAFPSALRRSSWKLRLWLIPFLLFATLGHTAESAVPSLREYRLRFYHTHTGERLDVVYRRPLLRDGGAGQRHAAPTSEFQREQR
jgi:hypothetical protein